MKTIIRLGDPTDHGGQVVGSGAPYYLVEGIPVALLGDP
ncbi:PAAR domain-containing protein, partial [Zoogloea ramigera]